MALGSVSVGKFSVCRESTNREICLQDFPFPEARIKKINYPNYPECSFYNCLGNISFFKINFSYIELKVKRQNIMR